MIIDTKKLNGNCKLTIESTKRKEKKMTKKYNVSKKIYFRYLLNIFSNIQKCISLFINNWDLDYDWIWWANDIKHTANALLKLFSKKDIKLFQKKGWDNQFNYKMLKDCNIDKLINKFNEIIKEFNINLKFRKGKLWTK